ncbi:hypothetical protein [Streptomyces sp. H72]
MVWEGVRLAFERLQQRLVHRREVRATEDVIVGAFTGPAAAPRTLLLGRYDTEGQLRFTGRTTTLPHSAGRARTCLPPAPRASSRAQQAEG